MRTGSAYDLYFDDETWTIRYIVVETGPLLSAHKVLISLLALRQPALRALHIWVNLTWKQVEASPSFDLHKPVSRQHEIHCCRPTIPRLIPLESSPVESARDRADRYFVEERRLLRAIQADDSRRTR